MMYPRLLYLNEFSRFQSEIIAVGAKVICFEPNSYLTGLFSLNDNFYITKGISRLSLISDDGIETIIGFWGKGSIFPLMCNEQKFTLESQIFLKAITPVETLAVTPKQMQWLLTNVPGFAIASIDHYCRFCNLLLVRDLIGESDSLNRICNFLVIYNLYGSDSNNQNVVALSQEEIAMMTGLSRVQVTRKLTWLQNEGIIKTSRKMITIVKIDKLKTYCMNLLKDEI